MTTNDPAAEGSRAAAYDPVAEACASAATLQGLDGIVEYLRREVGYIVEVEQTGGFVMVATIYLRDGDTFPNVCITNEGEGDEQPTYIVGLYRSEGDEGVDVPTYDTMEAAAAAVAKLIAMAINFQGEQRRRRDALAKIWNTVNGLHDPDSPLTSAIVQEFIEGALDDAVNTDDAAMKIEEVAENLRLDIQRFAARLDFPATLKALGFEDPPDEDDA